MMTTYSESEILDVLDSSDFPFLGNMNVDYVRGKLMLFRDPKRWAIVFNWIVWTPQGDGPEAQLECFGNCVKGPQGLDDFNSRFVPVQFEFEDELIGATIRGKSVPLPPAVEGDEGFYALAGLASIYKDEMVATDDEVRKRIPADLPKLLVIEDWFHPNMEKPSETETFQQIAKVLVTGEVKHYKPSMEPNTDGRKWYPK